MNWGLFIPACISAVATVLGSGFLANALQKLSENKKVHFLDAFLGIYLVVGAIILAIFAA